MVTTAYTFAVGQISEEVKRLLIITKQSLFKGIEMAVDGKKGWRYSKCSAIFL